MVNLTNFLEETKDALKNIGKTTKDVISVGTPGHRISWEDFEKLANFRYDDGYGHQIIDENLKVYGKDFILYRAEYDGSEWWESVALLDDYSPNTNKIEIKSNFTYESDFEPDEDGE